MSPAIGKLAAIDARRRRDNGHYVSIDDALRKPDTHWQMVQFVDERRSGRTALFAEASEQLAKWVPVTYHPARAW